MSTVPRQPHRLVESCFYRLSSPHKLSALLQISVDDLRSLCEKSEKLYREWDEKKPTGGTRHIECPKPALKPVQARVARLLSRIKPADYLFCPVKRRCYVTNAARHQGNRVIRCLDVRKYFPSTPSWRVFWFFRTVMQCSPDIAAMLTKLATYKNHLPTGSPLSPIMAYFAHIDVWESVAAIAKRHGLTLTVYVDDVTLSGPHVPDHVLWEVRKAIHSGGLRYHKEKTYVDRPAEITGVIVRADKIGVPHRQYLKLHRTKREQLKPKNAGSKQLAGRLEGLRGQMEQVQRVNKKSVER